MLVKFGAGYLDPTSVIGVAIQPNMNTGDNVILFWLDGVSHPILHSEYEGDEYLELARVSELFNQAIELARKDAIQVQQTFVESGSPGGPGVEMIRLPVDELTSREDAAYEAGWDDHSARMNRKVLQLSTEGLEVIYDAMMEGAAAGIPSDGLKETFMSGMKKSYEIMAADLGGKIEWQP